MILERKEICTRGRMTIAGNILICRLITYSVEFLRVFSEFIIEIIRESFRINKKLVGLRDRRQNTRPRVVP